MAGENEMIEKIGNDLQVLKSLELPSSDEIAQLQKPPFMYSRKVRLATALCELRESFHEFFS
jgi:hypothetical protein